MNLRFFLCLVFAVSFFAGAAPGALAQEEASWPTVLKSGDATATIYEPQPTSWPDRTKVYATAAMIIAKPGRANLVGTVDISAATSTDLTGRWVTFSHIEVLATHFPMLDTDQAAKVQAKIVAIAAKMGGRRIPLDTLLLALNETPVDAQPVATKDVPPVIFHSNSPAVLVVTDGQPVMTPLKGTGLTFAVNTNWSLFQQTASGEWFLLDGANWLSAPAFTGPYQPAGVLPADFNNLPDDASFADVRKYVPNGPAPAVPPTVFVSTKPAQIIVTDGPPKLTPVAGAPLQFVSNTEAEVIFDPASSKYFVLFSGRWFSAPGLDGPWTYATPDLPATFALIPPDGPQAAVLASVPGTAQAQEAVITAQIPVQTSLPVTATAQVTYAGTPNFVPIAGTDMSYAVNTYAQVIEANGLYYDCYNGAWYVSHTPTGPWILAASVPSVIYTIPPSSPLYPVTYVRIYSASPTVIVVGYTAGYTMGMISAAGVVVYGTGYYYPPYIVAGVVPIYYPYPYTYAGGVRYVPATGGWVTGGAVYGPYGGVAARSYYNPATGAYAHGSAVWGPNGGAAYGSFSNPSTGRYGSTSQSWSPYGRSGSSTVTGPNGTVNTRSGSNAYGSAGGFNASNGAQGAGVHNSMNGNNSGAVKTANGDVYAGHNGNVYQHSSSGWSQYDNGGFKPVTPPAAPKTSAPASGAYSQPKPPASGTYNQAKPSGSGTFSEAKPPGSYGGSTQSYNHSETGTNSPGGSPDFDQLNHDMSARQGGMQQQFNYRQSGGFGGGGFGGGGFGGGGRRR
jgi:hypothetical protein